ncbi:MAG: hypothetical protein HC938_14590 [Nitrospira sp.]|nr:hypothetical protein [Nitrospira sp.]
MPLPFHFGPSLRRYACIALLLTALWLPQFAASADSTLSVTTQGSTTTSTLLSIQFQTLQNGWAVGTGGTILRTADGGKKWKRVPSGTASLLTSVFFCRLLEWMGSRGRGAPKIHD